MREILVVRKVLQSFAPKLAGLCVKWHTDNQNVARTIGVGSRKSGLQSEAKRIFEVCVHHGISIEPEWVSRHPCPIHPNRLESSKSTDDST